MAAMNVMRWLAAPALCAFAGCSGGLFNSGSGGNPCPSGPVAVTAVAPPALIAPADGATGVPANGASVEITYDPPSGALAVIAPDGTAVNGAPLVPAQGSSGTTPPPGAVTSALPPLAAHTTYTVRVAAIYPPANPCVAGAYAGATTFTLGTFTTQ